jgi:hypothetical protein
MVEYTPHYLDGATVAGPKPVTEPISVAHLMPTSRRCPNDDDWHAVWSYDTGNGHEEFDGTKAAVLAWARARSPEVWVWSEVLQDLEPV